jgi:hypothetical protein
MGQISDLIPSLYHSEDSELIDFVDQTEPEIEEIQSKIRGITALMDVDRCPDEFLPYLAALTGVPVIGDNPATWRRQIRNWPHLLKIKGTAKSFEIFLDSLGITESTIHTYWRNAAGEYVTEKPDGAPYFDQTSGLWRNSRTHYFGLEILWGLTVMPWREWSQNLWEKIAPWMERVKPFHSELLNVRLKTLFDFGDIIFFLRGGSRRELRQGHAMWSLMPRFDLISADAIPLDWRPWQGYLHPRMTARTTGGLTGVSHLDRFLHFDQIGADFWPLDVAMPYIETDNPPIIVPLLRRNARTMQVSIRGPTGEVSRQRRTMELAAMVTISRGGQRQTRAGTANPRPVPGHLDKFLRFDSMPADFVPLDTTVPYVEADTPPGLLPLFSRAGRSALGQVEVSGILPAQRRQFFLSPRMAVEAAAAQKWTGTGCPSERPNHVDNFLTFDSTPADFMPLDNALPHLEGTFVWR